MDEKTLEQRSSDKEVDTLERRLCQGEEKTKNRRSIECKYDGDPRDTECV